MEACITFITHKIIVIWIHDVIAGTNPWPVIKSRYYVARYVIIESSAVELVIFNFLFIIIDFKGHNFCFLNNGTRLQVLFMV